MLHNSVAVCFTLRPSSHKGFHCRVALLQPTNVWGSLGCDWSRIGHVANRGQARQQVYVVCGRVTLAESHRRASYPHRVRASQRVQWGCRLGRGLTQPSSCRRLAGRSRTRSPSAVRVAVIPDAQALRVLRWPGETPGGSTPKRGRRPDSHSGWLVATLRSAAGRSPRAVQWSSPVEWCSGSFV